MTRLAPLLALLACSGDGTTGPEAEPAGVVLRFDVEESDTLLLQHLALRVDELVLAADGPDGSVSVSHTGGTMVSLLPSRMAPPEVVLELDPGSYRDVHTTAHLRPFADEPSVEVMGTFDGQPFQLVVTMEVGLEGKLGELNLGPGPQVELVYTLRPAHWLDDLEEIEPTGELLLIDADHNVPLYFEIVEELEESTDADVEEADG